MVEYWIYKKKRLTKRGYFHVDWDTVEIVIKSSVLSRRHWVSKFESGVFVSGRMIKYGSNG